MKKFISILFLVGLMSCNRVYNHIIEGDPVIEKRVTKVVHYPKKNLTKIKVIEYEKEEISD